MNNFRFPTFIYICRKILKILTILRLALTRSAKVEGLGAQVIDMKAIDSMKDQAPKLAKYVRDLSERNLNCLFKYVNVIKDYALTVANPLGIYLLLEICSISPFNVTKYLHENVEWLKVRNILIFIKLIQINHIHFWHFERILSYYFIKVQIKISVISQI
jgi:hypothetical protein